MKSRKNHIQKKLFPGSEQKNIDPRNKLNDLNGKEWIKFLKSWFVFDALKSDLNEEKAITKDIQTLMKCNLQRLALNSQKRKK